MTREFFQSQVKRLTVRFGEKAFDHEFVRLTWSEVHDMSEHGFTQFVDVLIGSRTHHKPPLLSEFREARLAEQKRAFENDLRGATNFLKRKAPEEMRVHLRKVLSKEFGGVESVADALAVARHRLKIAATEGPEGA